MPQKPLFQEQYFNIVDKNCAKFVFIDQNLLPKFIPQFKF